MSEAVLFETPAAITVEIVFAPSGKTTAASGRPATTDEGSQEGADAIDRPNATALKQADEPPELRSLATSFGPSGATIAASKPSPSVRKTDERQTFPAKRQSAPLAITPSSNAIASSDPRDGGSTTVLGTSEELSPVPSAWKAQLLSHLERYKRYPDAARARRLEGTALLNFGMDRDGRVLTYYLVRSSGSVELDDEVLAMIERASPLPPVPPELSQRIVQLVVPVRFRM